MRLSQNTMLAGVLQVGDSDGSCRKELKRFALEAENVCKKNPLLMDREKVGFEVYKSGSNGVLKSLIKIHEN